MRYILLSIKKMKRHFCLRQKCIPDTLYLIPNASRGATLLDTLIGVALMVLVFVGITAVFQLSIDVVSNNKARTGALALAQERMEFVRSLSYNAIGTVNGIPSGNIAQEESVSLNGVSYTRKTLVRYIDDPKDGEGVADINGITADSKEIKVTLSWSGKAGARSIPLTSRVSPKGVEQAVPGGTLEISVIDANAQAVSSALVSILNSSVSPSVDVDVLTDADGESKFIGAPEGTGYEIVVTKPGQSTAQTYTADAQNPNPNPGHLTVADSQTTAATFAIDVVGTKTVQTFTSEKTVIWNDPLTNDSLLASTTDTVVASGNLRLTGPGAQNSPGFAESASIASTDIIEWTEFSWVEDTPVDTWVEYRLYFPGNLAFEPIPDSDLLGNIAGFTTSPVDLTGLSTSTYTDIRAHMTLISQNQTETPKVDSYTISYEKGAEALPNLAFRVHGNKTIGTDGTGSPIYKYDQALSSGAGSSVSLSSLEWDSYTVTVDGVATGYDIAESCETQPVYLAPAGSETVKIILSTHTTNSLLVDVKDDLGTTLENASVRLYRTPYDTTQSSSSCGQTFFSGLSEGTVSEGNAYSMDVNLSGYQSFTSTLDVDVSGQSRFSVELNSI
jgi:hypothetical protein